MRFLGSLWVLCGCVAVSVSAADWPRFLGSRMDASSPETNLLDRIPAGGPPVLWDKAVGTGYSAPSVAGGRV